MDLCSIYSNIEDFAKFFFHFENGKKWVNIKNSLTANIKSNEM